jgi:hypothetical protein
MGDDAANCGFPQAGPRIGCGAALARDLILRSEIDSQASQDEVGIPSQLRRHSGQPEHLFRILCGFIGNVPAGLMLILVQNRKRTS